MANLYIATYYRIGARGWKEIHVEGSIEQSDLDLYGSPLEYLDSRFDDIAADEHWRSGEYGARLRRQGADTSPEGEPLAENEHSM